MQFVFFMKYAGVVRVPEFFLMQIIYYPKAKSK